MRWQIRVRDRVLKEGSMKTCCDELRVSWGGYFGFQGISVYVVGKKWDVPVRMRVGLLPGRAVIY